MLMLGHHSALPAALLALTWATLAPAQRIAPGALAIEIHTSERRMHGREQPRFTPFLESDRWIIIDSTRRTSNTRTVFASLDAQGDDKAMIVTTLDGRPLHLTINPRRR